MAIKITRSKNSAPRPSRPLPTDRLEKFKQFDLIRAYAIASGSERKTVTNADAAKVSGLAQFTVSLSNAFFLDCGFITRLDNAYIVADCVHEFNRAYSWHKESSGHKLAPLLKETWFAQCLLPRLRFREMPTDEAITALGEEAGATGNYRNQISTLIDYLMFAGLVEIDGTLIRLKCDDETRSGTSPSDESGKLTPPTPSVNSEPAQDTISQEKKRTTPTTSSGKAVSFSIQVDVDINEISSWSPERITAFFSGVAQVLAAKKGADEES